jgi:hypothetical protein
MAGSDDTVQLRGVKEECNIRQDAMRINPHAISNGIKSSP